MFIFRRQNWATMFLRKLSHYYLPDYRRLLHGSFADVQHHRISSHPRFLLITYRAYFLNGFMGCPSQNALSLSPHPSWNLRENLATMDGIDDSWYLTFANVSRSNVFVSQAEQNQEAIIYIYEGRSIIWTVFTIRTLCARTFRSIESLG
jgi:hypothetical protein